MRNVFVNPAGQRDNLGDSVLRRPYLDALRERGRLHVLVGDHDDFTSGLGLTENDVAYRSKSRWLAALCRSAVARSADLGVNAGEVVGTSRERIRSLWQVVAAGLVRVGGGTVVVSGVSVRPGTAPSATNLGVLSRWADIVTWRDTATRDALGLGEVKADWAFSLLADDLRDPRDRPRVAVCMRGDRPAPTAAWVERVRTFAESRNVELVVVVQVRRDAQRARELATLLHAELIEWDATDDHLAQERKLRALYATCLAMISDRIHALIIAAGEGAVPIGTSTSSPDKLVRTFQPVTALPIAPGEDEDEMSRWELLIAAKDGLYADFVRARDDLRGLGEWIAARNTETAGRR